MKKWLRKANRGFILLGVLVIGIIVYCIIDANKNKSYRSEIEEVCRNYVSDSSILYSLPPLESGTDFPVFDDAYIETLYTRSEPLYQYVTNNEVIRHNFVDQALPLLEAMTQQEGKYPVSCTRNIEYFEIDNIYMGSATVYMNISSSFTFIDEEGKRHSDDYFSNEYYYLLIEDGNWKLISIDSSLNSEYYYF